MCSRFESSIANIETQKSVGVGKMFADKFRVNRQSEGDYIQ